MRTTTFLLLVLLATALPGTAQTAAHGGVIVHEAEGLYRVAARFTVPAAPDAVLAVLTDYENIPRFMPDVKRSVVRPFARWIVRWARRTTVGPSVVTCSVPC